ncbi:hypothetical protein R0381_003590 [Jeongeupia wiesaeckerbachi]
MRCCAGGVVSGLVMLALAAQQVASRAQIGGDGLIGRRMCQA